MADEKVTNRWIMVIAALVMQVCLGILYAYSVVRGPLMKEVGYTIKEAGYPYMASLFFFAVGMIFAGRWQDKAGPKKVAIFGGVLLALDLPPTPCDDCGTCPVVCAKGFDVRERIRDIVRLRDVPREFLIG